MKRISGITLRVLGGSIVLAGSFLITLNVLDLGTSSYEDGINRPTPDYRAVDVGAKSTAATCLSKCEKDELCSSWIYIKNSDIRPVPVCLFLPTVPPSLKDPCCVSGVIRRSIFAIPVLYPKDAAR